VSDSAAAPARADAVVTTGAGIPGGLRLLASLALACSLVGLLFCVLLYVSALSELVSGWLYEAMAQVEPHSRTANVAYAIGLALAPVGLVSGGLVALRLARAGTPLPRARLAFELGVWGIAVVVAAWGASAVAIFAAFVIGWNSPLLFGALDRIVAAYVGFAVVSLLVAWGTRRVLLVARKRLGGKPVVSSEHADQAGSPKRSGKMEPRPSQLIRGALDRVIWGRR